MTFNTKYCLSSNDQYISRIARTFLIFLIYLSPTLISQAISQTLSDTVYC